MTKINFILRKADIDIFKFETKEEAQQYKKDFKLGDEFYIIERTTTTKDRRI